MAKNNHTGLTIGDGFRFGIGFAIASGMIAVMGTVLWFVVLAGVVGSGMAQAGG